MRVLVLHNRYSSASPSGENVAVDSEIRLLRSAGLDVTTLFADSDEIREGVAGAARAGTSTIFSGSARRDLLRAIQDRRPDVVHVHNVFPLLSPWVVRTCHSHRIPVVRTAHNYRLTCVNGQHFRSGGPCLDCVGSRLQLPGLIHGCYRGSRLQTLPMSTSQLVHGRTWRDLVTTHVALTPFMAQHLVRSGVPAERVTIRPSWVPDAGRSDVAGGALFVGRLDEAKGIDLLLSAWGERQRHAHSTLTVVGDGPLRAAVKQRASVDPSVRFLGRQTRQQVAAHMRSAGLVIVPSRWFEGYPLVLAEAFSHGRGVLTVAGGACQSVLEQTQAGWVADPTPESLGATLASIDARQLAAAGEAARKAYEAHNSPEAALQSILRIYSQAVDSCAA